MEKRKQEIPFRRRQPFQFRLFLPKPFRQRLLRNRVFLP